MRRGLLVLAAAVVASVAVAGPGGAVPEGPEYPSPEWFQREAENYAKTQEEPAVQVSSPGFQTRWNEQGAANLATYLQRTAEGTWPWNHRGNICAYWNEQCSGEPFLYPGADPFYEEEGEVVELAFYDSQGALLSGRVWAPLGAGPGADLPGVVIETGSVQAPEPLYWWFAQTLVRHGYVVMTYDVRGQGRSDNRTPDGTPGTNLEPSVFVTNLVDAVDLFLSTPEAPYANNASFDRVDSGLIVAHNPLWEVLDRDRLGIVGHSLGATGVSVVQGLDPWTGTSGETNPVDVAVAWDNLSASGESSGGGVGEVVPRVPTMGQAADYGLTPTPKDEPPDPEGKKAGYATWRDAGVPTYEVVVQGGTHYEWSYIPTFPSTAWGRPWSGETGWGNPMVEHYSLAWLDRWLKEPDEPGFDSADRRLLADADWTDRMSFYYRSARWFPDRAGTVHHCEDIRAGCTDGAVSDGGARPAAPPTDHPDAGEDARGLPATGGGAAAVGLGAVAGALALRGARNSRTDVQDRLRTARRLRYWMRR